MSFCRLVSLGSSWLRQRLRLPLSMTLTVLNRTGHGFYISSHEPTGVTGVGEEKTMRVKCHRPHVTSRQVHVNHPLDLPLLMLILLTWPR